MKRLNKLIIYAALTLVLGAILPLASLAQPIAVDFDIKPQSCPNPLNTKSKGVLPAAILSTEDFDVTEVDPATLQLEGVAPLGRYLEDVSKSVDPRVDVCDCNEDTADGFMDLTLKFDNQEMVAALGPLSDGDVMVLTLTGILLDGTAIEGQDCVAIIHKERSKRALR